jgi:hypothetical protein
MKGFRIIGVAIPIFLILGLIAGLSRFGLLSTHLSIHHGVVMLNGFAGGLITLERTLSKPILTNLLSLSMLVAGVIFTSLDLPWGLWLVTGAIVLMILEEVRASTTHHWAYHLTQLIGLLCWLTANVKFQFSHFYPVAVPFWQAFILMMIMATRLKKIDRIHDLALVITLWLYASSIYLPFHSPASSLSSILLLIVALGVLRVELRYSSDAGYRLFIVYGWLVATAIGTLFSDYFPYSYDFVLHCFFLGFLFNMIFLNASKAIISKLGVADVPLAEGVWMILMSVGVLVRVIPGDIFGYHDYRVIGSLLSTLAIAGFIASVLRAVVLTRISRAF